VTIGGVDVLRVVTRQGDAVHLAPAAARYLVPGRAALPGTAPTWCRRTMCGLPWWAMASVVVEAELATRRGPYVCPVCEERAVTEL
jgi:hypothetical protein